MKRLLFVLVLVLSLACSLEARRRWVPAVASAPPPSGPTLISNATGSGLSGTITTSAINTTGANFIIAYSGAYSGPGALTDNKGNTYTALTTRSQNTFVGRMFYCENAVTGSGHTFTLTLTGGEIAASVVVAAFSGMQTSSSFDAENFTYSAGSASTVAVGSITPAQANEVLFAAVTMGTNGTTPAMIDNSYTVIDAIGWQAGVREGAGLAYKVVTSTSAQNPTWTITTAGDQLIGYHAAFKY